MSPRSHTADERKSTPFVDFRPSHLALTWSPLRWRKPPRQSTLLQAVVALSACLRPGAGVRLTEQTTEIVEGEACNGVVLDA
jgi:hypothetical protein